MYILKKLLGGLMSVIKGSPFSKQRYVDTLKMLFDLFAKSRKEGAIAIESDVEDPEKSPIFSRYPAFLETIMLETSYATPCAWQSPAA